MNATAIARAIASTRTRSNIVSLQRQIDDIEDMADLENDQCGNYLETLLQRADKAAEKGEGAQVIVIINAAREAALHDDDLDVIDNAIFWCEMKLEYTLNFDALVEEPTIEDIERAFGKLQEAELPTFESVMCVPF